MNFVKQKVHRLWEIADLGLRLTKDQKSRSALLSCYAGITRDLNDATEVSLHLSFTGQRFPITIRKSDIFTLAEIFHDREYATKSPIPRNALIIDCGANVGLSAIWFLSQCPGARVHAIEPEPANFRLLQRNVGARSDAVTARAAVGKQRGTVRLNVSEHGAMHSVKTAATGSGPTLEVPCLSLGDYLRTAKIDRVDVLKLDVEGSELDAIIGLGDLIDNVNLIVGEFHEQLVNEAEFYGYAEAKGFRCVQRRSARETGVHLFELARRP